MFSKELKKAIEELPSNEKDKLIFRLLKKDLDLANRLHFELVATETVEDRRNTFESSMVKKINQVSDRFYSIGYLLQDIRYVSGDINEHVKITKDKIGEISLNIKMLNQLLKLHNSHIQEADSSKSHTMCIYIIARAFKILLLITAINEDYFMDFKEELSLLGTAIGNNSKLMKTAINNGLDVNWLIFGVIPSDILKIHKDLKLNGYLK
jgi:hypothetical protein